VRIISGKYGGRKLVPFEASHIRPTTDRVKESLFNKIQFSIQGAFVLDLFSGTGNLAIEALSRGARQVIAVESHPRSVRIINKNKEKLAIGEELKVLKSDVFEFLEKNQTRFQIVFIDPPFTEKIADRVLMALSKSQCLDSRTEIFIESSIREVIKRNYSCFCKKFKKNYGDKFLSHYVIPKAKKFTSLPHFGSGGPSQGT